MRFDDLTSGSERSFTFEAPEAVITANAPDEVIPALRRIEDMRAEGRWAAGFIAYDAAPGLDPGLKVPGAISRQDAVAFPLVWFALFDTRREVVPLAPRNVRPAPYNLSGWTPDATRREYESAIDEIKRRIASGDTYQVNHTFRLRAAFAGDPYELYRDLVMAQRGAYGAYIDAGSLHVLSASPERFFRLDGNHITVRPMKGTIRRGRWPAEDDEFAQRLAASDKDRAENLMIVDLLRNDLGRISHFGSVRADRLMEIERYETLWQLTSEISADLRPDTGLVELLQALFPSGSVTGAPKQRTMEIISGLERSPRGAYCGAIGFLSPPGSREPDARFNVAIRTVVVDTDQGLAEYGVGGGITWDSTSAGEYEEARLKAQVLTDRRPDFSLIETMRWDPGDGFWLLDGHLDRLEASAQYFGFGFDRSVVRDYLAESVGSQTRSRLVRVLLDRSGRVRVKVAAEALGPLALKPEDGEAVRIAVADEPVSSRNVFLFHKTTLRRVYRDRARLRPDAADVLLVNERGEVTESTIANVVALIGGAWCTPPLDSGCLPGVFRADLLAGGEVIERPLSVEEVAAADELCLVNSVRGWRRATLID